MATQKIESARYSSGPQKIKFYPEDASASFRKGHMVYMDTDGQILEVASNGVKILGMAMADATGTTNNMIPVMIAQDGTEFEMNVYHATAASAVTANANLDQKFALYNDGDITYVNIGGASYDALMITEILKGTGKDVGDTYGRVKVVVLPEAQQLGATGT